MTDTTLTDHALVQFTASEVSYRHGLNPTVLRTDGAKFVAERGGA
jgi:hypothetical protein